MDLRKKNKSIKDLYQQHKISKSIKILYSIFTSFLLISILNFGSFTILPAQASTAKNNIYSYTYFKLSVDPKMHNDYGLTYPVTYKFRISENLNKLKAYKKYTASEAWTQILEKTSEDFFNGIEAVRFDHLNNVAYISVAFGDYSNEIYIKITDATGQMLNIDYLGITKYYDGRKAAVAFTADDWNKTYSKIFQRVCDLFTSKQIWLSVGIITGNTDWDAIQAKINAGYIEPVAHSRTHPHVPYKNYDSEIGGCKNDIIYNLTLPYSKGNQGYVWAWICPSLESNDMVRRKLSQYKYLAEIGGRLSGMEGIKFADWDSSKEIYKMFNRITYADYNYSAWTLNHLFNRVAEKEGIYHLGFHPCKLDWSPESRMVKHLDYISGRKNIWYVGIGHLYLYHFVQERKIVNIIKKEYKANLISAAGPSGGPHIRSFNSKGNLTGTSFFAYNKNFRGGVRIATGDIDGDGKDEIVTGAGPGGGAHARVFEKNGKFKMDFWPFGKDFRGGVDVACGDVDGDGIDEIAMSQFSQGQAWIKVYKFNTQRTILGEWNAYGNFEGGATVALGDVDQDGKAEVICGAGPGGRPHVRVFEANGKYLSDFWPFHQAFSGGVDVATGDTDGDGKDEIAMSQRSNGEAWMKVYRYNSARTILGEWRAYPRGVECGADIDMFDIDQDGKAEVLTGAGQGGGPHVRAFEANGQAKNPSFFAYDKNFRGGANITEGIFQ